VTLVNKTGFAHSRNREATASEKKITTSTAVWRGEYSLMGHGDV